MTDTQQVLANVLLENCKPNSKQNIEQHSRFKRYYIRNKDTAYTKTDESKTALLQELFAKFEAANNLPIAVNNTNRHLIYFTVFLNEEYVELIEIALQSIYDNTPSITFDVLFITDEEHKQKLLQKPILSKFNCFFHILSVPRSGPRASINKLAIFDFKDINQYEKILFLDCDTICIRDINEVFNLVVLPEKLYTGTCKNMLAHALATPTHGIMFFTTRDVETIVENFGSYKPFNAGQFVFFNTTRMRSHFENVRWLINNWPGDLFFEQGAMNYYFVINSISTILKTPTGQSVFSVTYMHVPKKDIPSRRVIVTGATNTACLTGTEELVKAESGETLAVYPDSESCIVHFAGTPLGGAKKLETIKEFLNARKL